MNKLKQTLIAPTASIREAIQTIDNNAMQIALVVDSEMHLLGTVTDGDIRGAILKGISLDEPVQKVMKRDPISVRLDEGNDRILNLMRAKRIHQIPLVDSEGHVVGIEILDEILQRDTKDNLVVIMAGGLGNRLHPLTIDCPKPLLKIGNKPILEVILGNFIEYGFRNFCISVNYKAEMIQDHFGNGSRWNIQIQYLQENQQLGTAGSLSLLPEKPSQSLLVMNGDLLTNLNFNHLLNFHRDHKAHATMCVREYDQRVPYGVVQVDNYQVVSIDEKPVQRFLVNAGMYVLEPNTLDLIPKKSFFNMTDLFETLIQKNMLTSVFPLREYWLDIGHAEDFKKANKDYPRLFKSE